MATSQVVLEAHAYVRLAKAGVLLNQQVRKIYPFKECSAVALLFLLFYLLVCEVGPLNKNTSTSSLTPKIQPQAIHYFQTMTCKMNVYDIFETS